ncbi:peptide MFS transporter [Olivibacter sitiensis]|uniref:peptide MFS transporter n=1 Tax=Olivibacter sitiensis TaxID=376470 RepID=UPI0003F6E0FA|nr:peptide MFS transporter [Olivibacter sitiensis]
MKVEEQHAQGSKGEGIDKKTIFGHPVGLYILFLTEMWERFSFYGMKALLIFYLTKYHFFSDTEGNHIVGNYAALVYALPILGGALADRFLGFRKAVTFGAVLLVLGHLGMAFEGFQAYYTDGGTAVRDEFAIQCFYFSMGLIIMGVGFLKPNISTIVGELYEQGDSRRDSGFTIFYMGINLGGFIATLLCGWLGETYGWRYGFGAAGIGMLFGLIVFISGQKYLMGKAEPKQPQLLRSRSILGISNEWLIYLLSFGGVFVCWQLVQNHVVVGSLLTITSILVVLYLIWFIATECTPKERGQMIVLIVLTLFTVVFWALFEQAYTSMNLFADRVVDRMTPYGEIKASQFLSLNSLFIILFAPVFAWIWIRLAKKNMEPSTPVKFAIGIILAGVGFGALVIGIQNANELGKVAPFWLALAYFFHTSGELSVSPVGLSAVTKLSVPKIVGFMMGVWFLATASSEYIASILANIAHVDTEGGIVADTKVALGAYSELYSFLLYAGIITGTVLLVLSPLLRKYMYGVK